MIWLEVLGIAWEPGKKLKLRRFRDFEEWLAREFVKETVKAIDSQSLAFKWPPLSPLYLQMKKSEGLSTKMWEATSEIKNALKVKRTSSRVVIGFDARRRHKRTKLPLLEIAKNVEFGSVVNKVPPRPLFREILRKFKTSLAVYYRRYQRTLKGGTI